MNSVFALMNCSQVVTLARGPVPRTGPSMRELGIVADGAVLVENGRIRMAAPRREVEAALPPGCEVIDAGGRVVMPGWVDAHTHPVFAGSRVDEYEQRSSGATYAEIRQAGGGIRATVRRTRAASENELVEAGEALRSLVPERRDNHGGSQVRVWPDG